MQSRKYLMPWLEAFVKPLKCHTSTPQWQYSWKMKATYVWLKSYLVKQHKQHKLPLLNIFILLVIYWIVLLWWASRDLEVRVDIAVQQLFLPAHLFLNVFDLFSHPDKTGWFIYQVIRGQLRLHAVLWARPTRQKHINSQHL